MAALESDWVDEIAVENHNNRIEINLKKKFEEEANYTIVSATDSQSSEPEMKITSKVNSASRTSRFNWADILKEMSSELKFYQSPQWFGNSFNFNEALMKFQIFMSNSRNKNLSTIIPQNIYEYWYCPTDRFDRNRYLSDLARCFEALLRELANVSDEELFDINGLIDLSQKYYPNIYNALTTHDGRGFDKVIKQLSYNRNRLAHGEYIEIGVVKEAEAITNYIALYVYVIALYS